MLRGVGWAFSSADRLVLENYHNAAQDMSGNFSTGMAVLGTANITATHT